MATRLLDWSFNPLIAAYFACTHEHESSAHIFCYLPNWIATTSKATPWEMKKVCSVRPRGIVPRIVRQNGIFTIHPKPEIPLEESLNADERIELIVISQEYAQELLFDLNHYGINSMTVFPDLDGLSRHINWYAENRAYWKDDDKIEDFDRIFDIF